MPQITKDYKLLIQNLTGLFDKLDPLGLCAPSGEYAQEISMLATKWRDLKEEKDIKTALLGIFTKQIESELAETVANNQALVRGLLQLRQLKIKV